MAVVRSMRGTPVDFDRLMAQNPHKVALGNARMNARGDRIGRAGKVEVPRETLLMHYNRNNPKAVKQTVALHSLTAETLAAQAVSPAEAVNALRKQKKPPASLGLTERPRQGAVPLATNSPAPPPEHE